MPSLLLPEDVEACSLSGSGPSRSSGLAKAAPESVKHSYQPQLCRLQLTTSTSSPSPALSVTATRPHDLLIPPDCLSDAQLLATPQAIRPRAPNGPFLRVFSHGRLHWLNGRTPQRYTPPLPSTTPSLSRLRQRLHRNFHGHSLLRVTSAHEGQCALSQS